MTAFDLRSLARALGGEVSGGQVLAPGPGHGPRDRSMAVQLNPAGANGFVVFSHAGDDFKLCRDHVMRRLKLDPDAWRERREPAQWAPPDAGGLKADEAAFVRAKIRTIVGELAPLRGTPGERYLRLTRGIDADAIADVLERADAIGWHPAVLFREPGHPLHERRLGCIVGVMTDPVTARPTGAISRTYLAADLTKVGKAKTLGRPMGIVRLSADDEVLEGLHLAEGQETALAAMSIGLRPMWSTGSTALMAAFPVLTGVEAINVVVDHDLNGAGERAARELEARWLAAGREVNLLRPGASGDLNDALRGFP